MVALKTVKIINPKNKDQILNINEIDYDPKIHTLFDEFTPKEPIKIKCDSESDIIDTDPVIDTPGINTPENDQFKEAILDTEVVIQKKRGRPKKGE